MESQPIEAFNKVFPRAKKSLKENSVIKFDCS